MNEDSDLDLLVVADTRDRRATARRIRRARPRRSAPLDIVVATAADVEGQPARPVLLQSTTRCAKGGCSTMPARTDDDTDHPEPAPVGGGTARAC